MRHMEKLMKDISLHMYICLHACACTRVHGHTHTYTPYFQVFTGAIEPHNEHCYLRCSGSSWLKLARR